MVALIAAVWCYLALSNMKVVRGVFGEPQPGLRVI